jgi:hypothetical protein
MIESPCTGICQLNLKSGLCKGCNRTVEEIIGWIRSSDTDKKKILLKIRNRRIDNN